MSDEGFDTRKLFPKTYLRAADLDGKDATAKISVVKNEPLPGEDEAHLVLYFAGKKKTLGLNVTNRKCLEKMFGFLTKEWHGKWITFGPVKQPKSADGIGILIKGSPDISETMTVQVTKYLPTVTLRQTRGPQVPIATAKPPASVDPVTGEVADPAEAAPATQTARSEDPGADAAADAFIGVDDPDGDADENEDLPGRGVLFNADDPERPSTAKDKQGLSAALADVPVDAVKDYRARYGGRRNSELTHGEAAEFTAWAVKEALA